MRLPPPLKWNQATDDLDYATYYQWLRDCEASLLPAGTIFPSPGQVWEAVRDCLVSVRIFRDLDPPTGAAMSELKIGPFWSAREPVPMCFQPGRLPKGERVRVIARGDFSECQGPKPLCACLRPLRYEAVEELVVPHDFRDASYRGYSLHVRTARPAWSTHREIASLNHDFTLVGDVA